MGDGSYMQSGVTVEESYAYGVPTTKKKWIVAPSGVCDPTMSDTRERLAPWRVATVWFRGTIAGAGSPIVFAQTSVQAFTAGPGDPATAAGGGATQLARSDTNAQQQSDGGGAVRAQQAFVATGLWFQWQEPYTVTAGADAIGATRTGAAFLRAPVSPYNKIMGQLLAAVINPGLRNGKQTACEFDLLALDMWAQGSGVADAKIGFGGIGASFYYLAVPDVSGGQGSGFELQVTLTQDRIVSIQSDAANPTPAGLDVIVPLRCVMMGYPICQQPAGIDYDALVAAMARAKASGSDFDPSLLEAAQKRAGYRG